MVKWDATGLEHTYLGMEPTALQHTYLAIRTRPSARTASNKTGGQLGDTGCIS